MEKPDVSQSELTRLVFQDELTDLYNRRYLYHYFKNILDWKSSQPVPTSLLMIDLDSFKEINDTHGHLEGDNILKQLGNLIKKTVRDDDIPVRYAGDEFSVVMPNTDKKQAYNVGETLRQQISGMSFAMREKGKLSLTISVGLATFPEDGRSPDGLIDAADKALYFSKRSGKNRVSQAGQEDEKVTAEQGLLRTFPCPTFVGREQVLAELKDVQTAVAAGKNTFVLIEGETGAGKTKLLKELERSLVDATAFFVTCLEPEIHIPYKPLLPIIKAYHEREPDILKKVIQNIPSEQLTELKVLFPKIIKEYASSETKGEEKRKVLFESLVSLLVGLSEERVLLILLDEFQNVDEGTLAVINCLGGSDQGRVMACGAIRTAILDTIEQDHPVLDNFLSEISGTDSFKHLLLTPLDQNTTTQVISALLPGRQANPSFDQQVYRVTAGNPLFIEEIIKNFTLKKHIIWQNQKWEIKEVKEADWNTSLDGVIQENFVLLDKTTAELVGEASVEGIQIDLNVLKELMGKNEGEVLEILDKARRARVIKEAEPFQTDRFTFMNQRVQEVTYQQLDDKTRQALHGHIGEIAEKTHKDNLDETAAVLSFHFNKAGNTTKATQYAKRVEQIAGQVFKHDEAAHYYERGRMIVRSKIKEAIESLDEDLMRVMSNVLRGLNATAKNMKLYPDGSALITQSTTGLLKSLEKVFNRSERFTISESKDILHINTVPVEVKTFGTAANEFLVLFKNHYIKSCTFQHGVTEKEIETWLRDLDNSPDKAFSVAGYWNKFLEEHQITNIGIAQRAFVLSRGKVTSKTAGASQSERVEFTPQTIPVIRDLLRYFCAALENIRLYPSGSQLTTQAIEQLNKSIADVFNCVTKIEFSEAEDVLIFNGVLLNPRVFGSATQTMLELIKQNQMKSMGISQGCGTEEMEKFLRLLSSPPKDEARAFESWSDLLVNEGITNIEVGGAVYTFTEQKKSWRRPGTAFETGAPGAEAATASPSTQAEQSLIDRVAQMLKSMPDKLTGKEFIEVAEQLVSSGAVEQLSQLTQRFLENLNSNRPEMRSRALAFYTNTFDKLSGSFKAHLCTQASPVLLKHLKSEQAPQVYNALLEASAKNIIFYLGKDDYAKAQGFTQMMGQEIKTLSHLSEEIKTKSQSVLTDIVGHEVFANVLTNLKSSDSSVQDAVLALLAGFGDLVLSPLIKIIKETDELPIREQIAPLIQQAGEEATTSFSNELVSTTEPKPISRMLSIIDIVNPPDIAAVLTGFLHHKDKTVREDAFNVVRKLSQAAALSVLLPLLKESDKEIVLATINVLGELTYPESAPGIIDLLSTTKDKRLQIEACRTLGKLGNPEAVPILSEIISKKSFLGFLGGYSDEVRGAATWALGHFKTPEAGETLHKALDDKSPEVRSAAKLGLKK